SSGAQIANLNIVANLDINGPYVGGVIADNGGTLFQVTFKGDIVASSDQTCWIGGIAGSNEGTISYSHAEGLISGSSGCSVAGGLVGANGGSAPGNID